MKSMKMYPKPSTFSLNPLLFMDFHAFPAQPATSYQLPATSYQLPATNYRLPATSYQIPATSYQLPVASPRRGFQYARQARTPCAASKCEATSYQLQAPGVDFNMRVKRVPPALHQSVKRPFPAQPQPWRLKCARQARAPCAASGLTGPIGRSLGRERSRPCSKNPKP